MVCISNALEVFTFLRGKSGKMKKKEASRARTLSEIPLNKKEKELSFRNSLNHFIIIENHLHQLKERERELR